MVQEADRLLKDHRAARPRRDKCAQIGPDRIGPADSTPRRALQKFFGHEEFRPGQAPLIEALLAGRDVIGILPTGAGKSLCYQLPALLMPGLTLVLSPLIALMTDQVRGLKEKGIAAEAIHGSMSGWEREAILEKARRGELCLLYLSPERFVSPAFEPVLSHASDEGAL